MTTIHGKTEIAKAFGLIHDALDLARGATEQLGDSGDRQIVSNVERCILRTLRRLRRRYDIPYDYPGRYICTHDPNEDDSEVLP